MRYLHLLLLISFSFPSYAQIKKVYIDGNGLFTDVPKNAFSYVLIEKLERDSAYTAQIYNMHDTLLMEGGYKDELLSVPNGIFKYYARQYIPKDPRKAIFVTTISHSADTSFYIKTIGSFINGKKSGLWVTFASRGIKQSEIMYKDGKENGLYKLYEIGTDNWSEGTMQNDTLEGKYKKYNIDSVLVSEMNISHGLMTDQTIHLVNAEENENLDSYLEKKLKEYRNQIIQYMPVIKFKVDETGKIINPQIIKGINPEFDKLLIAVIVNAPNYTPATYDKAFTSQTIIKKLYLYKSSRN